MPKYPKLKTWTLSLLLAGVGLAAFLLSFDAQVTLAIAAGVAADRAGLYPLIVDAAIVTGVLIGLWHPELSKKLRRYLWSAIGFWTGTSVLGNAFHVLALPPERVQLPPIIAIAVNTIPALSLFLIIHLATTTAFRAPAPIAVPLNRPVPRPQGRRTRQTADSAELVDWSGNTIRKIPAIRRFTDEDLPVTDDELLRLADEEQLSMSQIADRVGRSKSWVGANVKRLRDERDAEQASA